ncbi:MAG: hypothetical protein Phyf2KO_18700 [Phycisphaerales bacterium]
MTRLKTFGLLMAAAAGTSNAQQTITQTRDFFFDAVTLNEPVPLSFDAFDTMGGTRQLTGVSFAAQSSFSLEIIAENGEDFAINSDEWFFEAAIFNNLSFNPDQPGEVNVFGLGGVGYGPLSADLAPSDGVEQEGPDSVFYSFKDEYSGFRDALPFQVSSFEGSGQLDAEIYPFLSLTLPPPPPFFDLWITNHINFGTVELTYSYTEIPAPSSACLIAGAGLVASRRRR